MMTFWPSRACRCGAITRATASTGPPARNGTTSLIVCDGKSWDIAGATPRTRPRIAAEIRAIRNLPSDFTCVVSQISPHAQKWRNEISCPVVSGRAFGPSWALAGSGDSGEPACVGRVFMRCIYVCGRAFVMFGIVAALQGCGDEQAGRASGGTAARGHRGQGAWRRTSARRSASPAGSRRWTRSICAPASMASSRSGCSPKAPTSRTASCCS